MQAPGLHRYRLTITPVEDDGYPCRDRCSIEFEHRAERDWLRQLHRSAPDLQLGADEGAALLVASRILRDLAQRHRHDAAHAPDLAALAPALERLVAGGIRQA